MLLVYKNPLCNCRLLRETMKHKLAFRRIAERERVDTSQLWQGAQLALRLRHRHSLFCLSLLNTGRATAATGTDWPLAWPLLVSTRPRRCRSTSKGMPARRELVTTSN